MKKNILLSPNTLLVILISFFTLSSCESLQIGPDGAVAELDWLVMGYRGQITEDKWLTSDSASLFRNDVYVDNGRFVRHSSETLDKILEWRIKEDRKKGLFLSTKIKLNKTEPRLHIYRAQVAFLVSDQARDKQSITSDLGWSNWYTGLGQELVQAFSVRVPSNQRLDFPSISSRNGFDDPTALQVWQNRTRFNQNGQKGNIPLSIYLRGDEWLLKNEFDDTPFFEGGKFSGFNLGEAVPGEWLDLVIRMVNDKKDGLVQVYTREDGNGSYELVYEYEGPFFGPIDSQWYPGEINAREALGLPSYGIYPSTRFEPHLIDKWLDIGIKSVEVNHSEIRLLQYDKGEAPMEDILKYAEKNF
ncbi:MAG: polysaccharide lyase [Bacteroidia bacterium]|nr:polysaccharide lyase [Bacteroidia bacterium]